MGYSNYYDYGMPISNILPILNMGGPFQVLSIIAFIASIVCTVIVYRKYVSAGSKYNRANIANESFLASFLRFDKLILDGILKALYLFGAINTVFFALAVLISSIFAGAQVFFITLIAVVILVPLAELIHRVFYEFLMLSLVIARNTTEIKNVMQGTNPSNSNTSIQSAPTPVDSVPPIPGGISTDNVVVPPKNVCPHCGSPIKPDQKFCGVCGNSTR